MTRRDEITQTQAEQAAGVVKGLVSAFGLGDALHTVGQAAQSPAASAARCPKDGTLAAPGTKFCPEWDTKIERAVTGVCPDCGADTKGKFCPECGTKMS